jgi:NAD(P)-dependent dehydrogenase (short-subunit alcohol dehydrogenase family)/ribulose-5-phosphate 4-epimerase/fuculose-1-phosphate aldolase
MHPTIVNGLMCSRNAGQVVQELFGSDVVFLPYITPGYILYKEVERRNAAFKEQNGYFPKVYFLENHGIFVGGESVREIEAIYSDVLQKIQNKAAKPVPEELVEVGEQVLHILPAIRAALSTQALKVARIRNNALIRHFTQPEHYPHVARPFTPDGIVYCNPQPLYVQGGGNTESTLKLFTEQLLEYKKQHGYDPKIILLEGLGMVAVENSTKAVEVALDIFEDVMKIAWLADALGGVQHMSQEDVDFIESWEVEAYRKGLLAKTSSRQCVNKIAIVTGGSQGFGKGIAEGLLGEGAQVVIADVNAEVGEETGRTLANQYGDNVLFVPTNVTVASDLEKLMLETVKRFGGLDLLVSNAGVLRAGALTELQEADFDIVTQVNYKGYYLCAKYSSMVMKLQHQYNDELYMDIVQVNSKSGLEGSNKNFAYAGGKFGGIGLTQSFALELVGHHIKVNAVCPGNFFEGPLWSDPERGLFMQYLQARKVPGAACVEDVKKFYESKVPMGRGCRPSDVVKAIVYIIHQHYETGQAVPVAGGQVMLN